MTVLVSFKHLPNLEMVLPWQLLLSQVRSLLFPFFSVTCADPVKEETFVNMSGDGEKNMWKMWGKELCIQPLSTSAGVLQSRDGKGRKVEERRWHLNYLSLVWIELKITEHSALTMTWKVITLSQNFIQQSKTKQREET